MSSQIKEIYAAFASLSITLGTKVVTAKQPSELPNTIPSANLPLRLLTPISRFSNNFGISDTTWNSGLGSQVNQVTWTITDLFLYDAINTQIGVKALTDPLIDYAKEYLNQAANGGIDLPGNCWVDQISLRPDVIEYPLGSGNFYYGVVAIVRVTEKIP